jgi:hypothetical protein
MRNGEERWDELLRGRLEHFSAEPPEHVWQGIRSGMKAVRGRKRMIVLRRLTAAAVLLLAVMAGVLVPDWSGPGHSGLVESIQDPAFSPGPSDAPVASGSEQSVNTTQITGKIPGILTSNEVPDGFPEVGGSRKSALPDFPRTDKENMSLLSTIKAYIAYDSFREELKPGVKSETISADKLSEADQLIIAGNMAIITSGESDSNPAWKVGVHLSPGYSSHSASHSQAYARNMTYSDAEPQANMGGGFSLQYKTTSRWRLESGMYYSRNGGNSSNSPGFGGNRAQYDYASSPGSPERYFNTNVSLKLGQMVMNSTAGVIAFSHTPSNVELVSMPESSTGLSTAMLTPGEFSQVFDFVEVPLFARYQVVDSKLDVELVGGLSASLVVGNYVYMENIRGREHVGSTQDISTVNFSGNAGVGLIYAMGRNLSLSVEPRLSYFLNSINHSGDVNFKPWRVGVFTGISYEF